MGLLAVPGGQRSAQKGGAGTQIPCHEVPGGLCSWSLWKKWIFWLVWGEQGQLQRRCGDNKSYVMRFLADFVLDTPEKHLGLLSVLGGQRSALKGMPGHKSYAMRFLADFAPETLEKKWSKIVNTSPHEVPDRFCSWNLWKAWVCRPCWEEGKGQHRKGMQGHNSYFMKFLAGFVLDTFKKHGLAGRQSSAANIVDRSPFGVPGRFCSRNVWKTWVCWLFWGAKDRTIVNGKITMGLINR